MDGVSINEILEEKNIKILLQPIISIKNKKTIGYEVLARGINKHTGNLVGAGLLFYLAKEENRLFELDNLCREIAITNYSYLLKEKHLFLNYEISKLNEGKSGKEILKKSLEDLARKCDELLVERSRIIIEVVESEVEKMEDLLFFTDLCKKLKFLIALDDVGSGHSNLNRIPLIKPNIIKVDRYLVQDINKVYHKQEVFKAITNMSRRTGILVISEGVETKEEAIWSIELRADMIQGYFFAKPSENICESVDEKINNLYDEFRIYYDQKTTDDKRKNIVFTNTINKISREIKSTDYDLKKIFLDTTLEDYEKLLSKIFREIHKLKYIECIYFIDKSGKQISETIFREKQETEEINGVHLFSPAIRGEDHSLKQYFYKLHTGQNETYISNVYISLATGNTCRTLSTYVDNDVILAIDIDETTYQNLLVEINKKYIKYEDSRA